MMMRLLRSMSDEKSGYFGRVNDVNSYPTRQFPISVASVASGACVHSIYFDLFDQISKSEPR